MRCWLVACWCCLGCSSVVQVGGCFVGGRRGFYCWVSWRACTSLPNMKSIISSHNKALLSDYHRSQTQTNEKECIWRKKDQCPLDGKWLRQNVVYQATVSTQSSSETYVGLATNFKEGYRNHTASFRHQSKRNETKLSKHICTVADRNKTESQNQKH